MSKADGFIIACDWKSYLVRVTRDFMNIWK